MIIMHRFLTGFLTIILAGVPAFGAFADFHARPQWLADGGILQELRLPQVSGTSFRTDEVLVKFKGREVANRVPVPKGISVEQFLRKFHGRGDILYAEPNYIAHAYSVPNDTYYGYQWHLNNPTTGGIHTEAAWDVSQGTGVTVAVVDTGIAYENYSIYSQAPDFSGTIFVPGYDFVGNDTHPNDENGHGTHVAGTIAQSTNNGYGVAGVAYNAKLMPVRVLDRWGNGSYADVADGIRWAADHGAQVINLSLGGPSSSSALFDAVSYAYGKGVTVVAASGNDNGAVGYPAAYDDYVIAVGATRYDETRAPYSNYGLSLDIVAPGGDLNVDQNGDGYGDGVLQQTFSGNPRSFGYYFFQGTSMATPHVAGVAALVIANGNATTPADVRRALETTADDLGVSGRDDYYGTGLVNAAAALGYSAGPIDNLPQISITSPVNGATVAGAITITTTASDDVGVDHVDFLVDNMLINSDAIAPYETGWDSATVPDGLHSIIAKVFDTAGQFATTSVYAWIDNVNNAPIAYAGPDKAAFVGESVSFNGSAMDDGSIVSYEWDFGDGATASGISVSHSYAVAGSYMATLTVTDNGGLTANDVAIVTVTNIPARITIFEDSFEVSEWNGLWTEDSQNDWRRSSQRASLGFYSAEVDGYASNAALMSKPAAMPTGKTTANISFDWLIESTLDAGEYVAVDVSADGGNWVEQARIRGNVDQENVWHSVAFQVPAVSTMQVRFRGFMSSSNEDANVDNVKIVAE